MPHFPSMPLNTSSSLVLNGDVSVTSCNRACFAWLKTHLFHELEPKDYESDAYVLYYPWISHENIEFAKQLGFDYVKVAQQYYDSLISLPGFRTIMHPVDVSKFPLVERELLEDPHFDDDSVDPDAAIRVDISGIRGMKYLSALQCARIIQEQGPRLHAYWYLREHLGEAAAVLLANTGQMTWCRVDKRYKYKITTTGHSGSNGTWSLDYLKGMTKDPEAVMTDDLSGDPADFSDQGIFHEDTPMSEHILYKTTELEHWMATGQDLTYVAVYGTLRRGHGNHRVLGDSPSIETVAANLPVKMYNLGAFPAIVPCTKEHTIIVEVYGVSPDVFKALDRLEGYPQLYDRRQVMIGGKMCWIYFMHEARGEVIESGNWEDVA